MTKTTLTPEKFAELIVSRLTLLADDFSEMSGAECAEILRAEIECIAKLPEAFQI